MVLATAASTAASTMLACTSGTVPLDPDGSGDGGATDGGSSDGGADGGSGDGGSDGGADAGSSDGGADGGSGDGGGEPYTDAPVSGITTRLHDDYTSLVYVSWQQEAEARVYVEYSVDAGVWRQTPAVDAAVGPQEHLLLGVPYETEVSFRVVNDLGDRSATGEPLATAEQAVTTGALPSGVPEGQLLAADPDAWDADSPYVFMSMTSRGGWGDWWTFIVDRQARVVWARETSSTAVTLHPRVSWAGDTLLIDESTYWSIYDGGAASTILRMKIDGSDEEVIATPGLYHPFTDLDDGSLLWPAHDGGKDRVFVRAPDGTIEQLWECQSDLPGMSSNGSCAANTLSWHEERDVLLYSSYSRETIIEIDRTTGATLRWFGHHEGGWGFDPPESAFWWQHGGYFTEAGTLLTSSDLTTRGVETVVREYELDEETETLVEVWSFGVGDRIYGYQMGEAHRLPGGNTLHNTGDDTRLREATPDGTVVWEVNWDEDSMGRSVPVGDLYDLAP